MQLSTALLWFWRVQPAVALTCSGHTLCMTTMHEFVHYHLDLCCVCSTGHAWLRAFGVILGQHDGHLTQHACTCSGHTLCIQSVNLAQPNSVWNQHHHDACNNLIESLKASLPLHNGTRMLAGLSAINHYCFCGRSVIYVVHWSRQCRLTARIGVYCPQMLARCISTKGRVPGQVTDS